MTLAFAISNRTLDHRRITGWEGGLAPAYFGISLIKKSGGKPPSHYSASY